jgi:hypothetical protein
MNSFKLKTIFCMFCLFVAQTVWAVNTIDVSLGKGRLLLTKKHGGDGSAWGKANCSGCHFKRRIHRSVPKVREIVNSVGYRSCTGCHGQNGTNEVRRCTICHNNNKLPASPIAGGVEKHDFDVSIRRNLNDQDCLVCHYSSDMDGRFEPQIDLTYYQSGSLIAAGIPYRSGVEFCLRCHNETHQQSGYEIAKRFERDPLVIMDISYQYLDEHGYLNGSGQRTYAGLRLGYQYKSVVECTDCHAMHGTHNAKLIVDRSDVGMSLLEPALRNLPILIDTPNGDYSQLCVTCHAMNDRVEQGAVDTGNGLSGVHQAQGDCRRCHVHGMAAQTGL